MLRVCGSNGCGQLGLGHNTDVDEFVVAKLALAGPISVASGGNHTVVLNRGCAFVAGSNQFGQLGLLTEQALEFTELRHPEGKKWADCGAGWAFTILADEEGQIWSTGQGLKGELGLGETTQTRTLTHVITMGERVRAIKCGLSHCVVLTENGTVWGWGMSRFNQLAQVAKVVARPAKLDVGPVAAIACGRDYTLLLASGSGSVSVLGKFRGPELPQGTWHDIHSGWTSICARTSGGCISVAGNNSHGQLVPPRETYEAVAAGSEHYLGFTGTQVETWGWGEHGNCPSPFRPSGKLLGIYGGCATSFIYTSI